MGITMDKSRNTIVTVNGNGNQLVTNSKNARINNAKEVKSPQQWLQIIYWVVGIVLALIGIYKFFLD
jgi:hypothetical protein